jgi:hypothetical protein
MRALALPSLVIAAIIGCSATPSTVSFHAASSGTASGGAGGGSSSSSSGTGNAGSGSTGTSGLGGGLGLGGSIAGAGGGTPGCSTAAELVYVFSLDNEIYSFDPPSKTFTQIATPDCQTGGGQPNSMAIDRNLVAWLNYIDDNSPNGGSLYTFDLNTKSGCQLAVDLPDGYTQVGMGFSTDTVGGTSETLYVDGIGGAGLAKIDMTTMSLVPIGAFSGDSALTGQSAELTGTGAATLFGYFTTSPYVRVAQINMTSGAIISDFELNNVSPPDDWAFSFWGGDFYLYAAPGTNNTGNSSVIHYSPATKTVDPTYVSDVGFTIIGAGVSTCAPLTPPS